MPVGLLDAELIGLVHRQCHAGDGEPRSRPQWGPAHSGSHRPVGADQRPVPWADADRGGARWGASGLEWPARL